MINKKNSSRLYIDFDGVIVDTITPLSEIFNKYPTRDRTELCKETNWFKMISDAKIIEGSIEAINLLLERNYDVSILSHINSIEELEAKIEFLEKHITDYKSLNIIGVPKAIEKTLIMDPKNNILVDDYSKNLDIWESEGGIGIKFSKKQHDKYKTIDNLMYLLDISTQKV